MTFKTYLSSTCSHAVLGYLLYVAQIDRLEAMRKERIEVRKNRNRHINAAKQQGVLN